MRISGPVAYILLYGTLYAAFGVASPFWPKFFETRDLSSEQIGFILSAAMLVRLGAGPLVGRLADLWRSRQLLAIASDSYAAGCSTCPHHLDCGRVIGQCGEAGAGGQAV